MFKGEDEDEDIKRKAATRYACMPSLLALQQMRNRLHLANTGKKLTKWTAAATGRELKNLAQKIDELYSTLNEEMGNLFMLLARARFYVPHINDTVLEHKGRKAAVSVNSCLRPMAGVKVVHMEIVELGHDTYAHLGIGRGGKCIQDAKTQWREQIKKLISMLTKRISYSVMERANRNANVKNKILAEEVIPKTMATMQYIHQELEKTTKEKKNILKVQEIQNKSEKSQELEKKTIDIIPNHDNNNSVSKSINIVNVKQKKDNIRNTFSFDSKYIASDSEDEINNN